MKRRNLLAAAVVVLALALSGWTVNAQSKVVHLVDSRNQSATILLPGATKTLKFMLITDSHISLMVEQEAEMAKYAERMHSAYTGARQHFSGDGSKTASQHLDDVLQRAKNEHVELLLLTGDIVNFPSPASVAYVCDRLKQTGIPWLYIAGNHDWHYQGLPGTSESLRKTWIEKSLMPFYRGRDPLFYSEIIKGINFVGIDNSTSRISKEQTEFLKEQLARPEPIILLSHRPYNLEEEDSDNNMADFVHTLSEHSNQVVGIFTGHVHVAAYSYTGNVFEYVGLPCFEGAGMVVEIKPAPEAPGSAGK
jgi:predicted MPP superfamily phosphohydrolase